MRTVYSIFAFVFLSCYCYSQNNRQSVMEHRYELIFYPTGSPKDIRYSIIINNDSIIAKNHCSKNYNKRNYYKGKVSVQQMEQLFSLYHGINTKPVINNHPSILDTWSVILIVDAEKVYKDDDFSFESPPKDIAKMIQYLVELGVIKIKLYGFA